MRLILAFFIAFSSHFPAIALKRLLAAKNRPESPKCDVHEIASDALQVFRQREDHALRALLDLARNLTTKFDQTLNYALHQHFRR